MFYRKNGKYFRFYGVTSSAFKAEMYLCFPCRKNLRFKIGIVPPLLSAGVRREAFKSHAPVQLLEEVPTVPLQARPASCGRRGGLSLTVWPFAQWGNSQSRGTLCGKQVLLLGVSLVVGHQWFLDG